MSKRDVGESHLGLDAQNGRRGEAAIAAGVPVFDDGDAVVALRGVEQGVAEGSGVAVARHGLFFVANFSLPKVPPKTSFSMVSLCYALHRLEGSYPVYGIAHS